MRSLSALPLALSLFACGPRQTFTPSPCPGLELGQSEVDYQLEDGAHGRLHQIYGWCQTTLYPEGKDWTDAESTMVTLAGPQNELILALQEEGMSYDGFREMALQVIDDEMKSPTSVNVDSAQRIIVKDRGANCFRKVTFNDTGILFQATEERGGMGAGKGAGTYMMHPDGRTVRPAGSKMPSAQTWMLAECLND